jgi:hypothetical protein
MRLAQSPLATPTVVTVCTCLAPPNRGALNQRRLLWHSRAGAGAVHSINKRHRTPALSASDFLLRRGHDWTDRAPTPRSLQVLSGTLDGEAVTCAPEGIASFDRIARIALKKAPGVSRG